MAKSKWPPVREQDLRHPDFARGEPDDYEFRDDGKIVRKDRWEMGIRSIASALSMHSWEISEVVEAVKALVEKAKAKDEESE